MGKVDLLHNYNGVLHILVQEVYTGNCSRIRPPLTPLDWAVPRPHLHWKLNPIRLWLSHGERVFPLRSQSNTVLYLVVGRKQPCLQVGSKLWALNPKPLIGAVGEALFQHQPLFGRL